VVRSVLASWHPDPESSARASSPIPFIDRAQNLDPEHRTEFLFALRRRLDRFPYEWVHSSWILETLPPDPLLRNWSLRAMPRSVREPLGGQVSEISTSASIAPPWFAEWWRRRLLEHLPYPRPLPGRAAAGRPLDYLYLLPEIGLKRLLRRCGARALAAALRKLEDREIVAIVGALPLALRARVIELSRKEDYPDPGPWQGELEKLLAEGTPVSELTLLLALEDVGAQATALGSRPGAARMAYRLPVALGRRLLSRLETNSGELVSADIESWQTELRKDLGFLNRSGAVSVPNLNKELWA